MTDTDFFCSAVSLERGEQLFGTATRVDTWLLLEYNRPWKRDAFPESDLPDAVKAHLSQAASALPNSRIQFIRQQPNPPGVALFVAVTREREPVLYKIPLHAYKDLLKLDIPAIARGEFPNYRTNKPLYIVCGNSKRDRCCALYGTAVYRSLQPILGEAIWQTTHLGGHRFAATMVCLPQGVAYGRVRAESAAGLIDRTQQGQIALESYRGRSYYDTPVQVADYFLRRETGFTNVAALRLLDAQQTGDGEWTVQFAVNSKEHRVSIQEAQPDFSTYSSCGEAKLSRYPQYGLVKCEVV